VAQPDPSGGAGFDRFVVVDWSASATPKRGRDSIWVASLDASRAGRVDGGARSANVQNCPTRSDAIEHLTELVAQPARVLVGVDFSLGYPAGTASAWGIRGPAWSGVWSELARLVVDGPRNANNRFEVASELNRRAGNGPGPFWGCSPGFRTPWLASTKPPPHEGLAEWRLVEQRLRADGHRPFSSWQLLGAGAVGSQSVVGIAALARLVDERTDVDVWPFTCGATMARKRIVFGEVWPALVPLPALDGRVRDEVQVVTVANHLADAQREGRLAAMFTPELSDEERRVVETEEGWVLGA